ncbi:hypothetical protein CS379_07210 [Methylobacterium frigidaeris]|nr:hypothetical protein CS379_07210 [Methylobacterium frigidaeris]
MVGSLLRYEHRAAHDFASALNWLDGDNLDPLGRMCQPIKCLPVSDRDIELKVEAPLTLEVGSRALVELGTSVRNRGA